MNVQEFIKIILSRQRELKELTSRKLPIFAGRIAINHFRDNFRKGGFVDRGLTIWKKARRLESGGMSAAANYSTLLSARNHLFSQTRYYTSPHVVVVSNNVIYARIHNEGGEIAITHKMRRFAWAKYFEAGGGKKRNNATGFKPDDPPEAEFWKRMALTKKRKITIPKRQFLGNSEELRQKIEEKINVELMKLFTF